MNDNGSNAYQNSQARANSNRSFPFSSSQTNMNNQISPIQTSTYSVPSLVYHPPVSRPQVIDSGPPSRSGYSQQHQSSYRSLDLPPLNVNVNSRLSPRYDHNHSPRPYSITPKTPYYPLSTPISADSYFRSSWNHQFPSSSANPYHPNTAPLPTPTYTAHKSPSPYTSTPTGSYPSYANESQLPHTPYHHPYPSHLQSPYESSHSNSHSNMYPYRHPPTPTHPTHPSLMDKQNYDQIYNTYSYISSQLPAAVHHGNLSQIDNMINQATNVIGYLQLPYNYPSFPYGFGPTSGTVSVSAPGSASTPVSGPRPVSIPGSGSVSGPVSIQGSRKRKAVSSLTSSRSLHCHSCMTTETPEWRRGPMGPRTLCNACGLIWAKLEKAKQKKQEQENGVDNYSNVSPANVMHTYSNIIHVRGGGSKKEPKIESESENSKGESSNSLIRVKNEQNEDSIDIRKGPRIPILPSLSRQDLPPIHVSSTNMLTKSSLPTLKKFPE